MLPKSMIRERVEIVLSFGTRPPSVWLRVTWLLRGVGMFSKGDLLDGDIAPRQETDKSRCKLPKCQVAQKGDYHLCSSKQQAEHVHADEPQQVNRCRQHLSRGLAQKVAKFWSDRRVRHRQCMDALGMHHQLKVLTKQRKCAQIRVLHFTKTRC